MKHTIIMSGTTIYTGPSITDEQCKLIEGEMIRIKTSHESKSWINPDGYHYTAGGVTKLTSNFYVQVCYGTTPNNTYPHHEFILFWNDNYDDAGRGIGLQFVRFDKAGWQNNDHVIFFLSFYADLFDKTRMNLKEFIKKIPLEHRGATK